jgi:hypothetical protein
MKIREKNRSLGERILDFKHRFDEMPSLEG